MAVAQELLDKISGYEQSGETPDRLVQGLSVSESFPDIAEKVTNYRKQGYTPESIIAGIKASPIIGRVTEPQRGQEISQPTEPMGGLALGKLKEVGSDIYGGLKRVGESIAPTLKTAGLRQTIGEAYKERIIEPLKKIKDIYNLGEQKAQQVSAYLEQSAKEPATSFWDFTSRKLPESLYGTAKAVFEFPKTVGESIAKPINKAIEDYLEGNVTYWQAGKNIGKEELQKVYEGVKSTGEFMGKPLGTYGWKEAVDAWTNRPFESALGIMPIVGPVITKAISAIPRKAEPFKVSDETNSTFKKAVYELRPDQVTPENIELKRDVLDQLQDAHKRNNIPDINSIMDEYRQGSVSMWKPETLIPGGIELAKAKLPSRFEEKPLVEPKIRPMAEQIPKPTGAIPQPPARGLRIETPIVVEPSVVETPSEMPKIRQPLKEEVPTEALARQPAVETPIIKQVAKEEVSQPEISKIQEQGKRIEKKIEETKSTREREKLLDKRYVLQGIIERNKAIEEKGIGAKEEPIAGIGAKLPVSEGKNIYHFTKKENIKKIVEEGFNTGLPPIHGTGAFQKRDVYTKENKSGMNVLYFTTDTERWNKAQVYTGEGKGTKDYSYYDYKAQKWITEKKALKTINLSPLKATIKQNANILVIDSMEKYLSFQGEHFGDAFPKDRMNDVINQAKDLEYDILNIKYKPEKWLFKGQDYYKEATGAGGKDDYFIFNKDIIDYALINEPEAKTKEAKLKGESLGAKVEPTVGVGAMGTAKGERPTSISQMTASIEALGEAKKEKIPVELPKQETPSQIKERIATIGRETGSLVRKIGGYLASPPKEIEVHKIMTEAFGEIQLANKDIYDFYKTIEKNVPANIQRAIVKYILAEEGGGTLLEKAEATKDPVLKQAYIDAANLPEEYKLLAQNIRNLYDDYFTELKNEGILEEGVDEYVNRHWIKENDATKSLRAEANSGILEADIAKAQEKAYKSSGVFLSSASLLRKRIYETEFEAEQAGKVAKYNEIGKRIVEYATTVNKLLITREAIRQLKEAEASDGRPVLSAIGFGKRIPISKKDLEAKKYIIFPDVKLDDAKVKKGLGLLKDAVDEGKISQEDYDIAYAELKYLGDRQDYKEIPNRAFKQWKWLMKDEKGKPIMMKVNLVVHPEYFQRLKNQLGTALALKTKVGRAAAAVSSTVKNTVLSLSGFHIVQESIRAASFGIKPWSVQEIDINNPNTRILVKAGLMIHNREATYLFSEGSSAGGGGLMKHLPVIGNKLLKMTNWMFEDWIPRLKNAAAIKQFEINKKRYPSWTEYQVAKFTADQINPYFGELNYRAMGRNPDLQYALRLTLLAPDWGESEAKSFGNMFRFPGGRPTGVFIAAFETAAVMYLMSRVVNYLVNGDPHFEPRRMFSVIAGGREYTVRSIPGDFVHVLGDPVHALALRANPLLRTVFRLFYQRDEQGRKMGMIDQISAFVRGLLPIPLQKVGKAFKEGGIQDVLTSTVGITSWKARSNLEKVLDENVPEIFSRLKRTPEEVERGGLKTELRKKWESGDLNALDRAYKEGEITARDYKNIKRALIVNKFKIVAPHFEVAKKAWEAATPEEKRLLLQEYRRSIMLEIRGTPRAKTEKIEKLKQYMKDVTKEVMGK